MYLSEFFHLMNNGHSGFGALTLKSKNGVVGGGAYEGKWRQTQQGPTFTKDRH